MGRWGNPKQTLNGKTACQAHTEAPALDRGGSRQAFTGTTSSLSSKELDKQRRHSATHRETGHVGHDPHLLVPSGLVAISRASRGIHGGQGGQLPLNQNLQASYKGELATQCTSSFILVISQPRRTGFCS